MLISLVKECGISKDNVRLGSDCPSMERLDEIIDVCMKREKVLHM